MTLSLKSITISNFRSIRGQITVPLDAPVVLVHGQNGIGKTSILSAIELGLTGEVQSLMRLDPDLGSHLVHKEAADAKITITATGLDGTDTKGEISITQAGKTGTPLLRPDLARFYSERCYLAQASLGRLLELYEDKDTRRSDSPLTRFVKDLLGLDHLDALIDGLHDAGDVRRFRSSLPVYWEAREVIPSLEKSLRADANERARLADDLNKIDQILQQQLAEINILIRDLSSEQNLSALLERDSEEPELQRLAAIRRDIIATRDQWLTIQSPVSSDERRRIETSASVASSALEKWRGATGSALNKLFGDLSTWFTNLPSLESVGPEVARLGALKLVESELERCDALLASDAQATTRLVDLEQSIERARARAIILDEQIAAHTATSGVLAQALAAVLPHVHGDDCPVCGRDFREHSEQSLQAHISQRIAALTQSAGLLQTLTQERVETSRALAYSERELSTLTGSQLSTESRDALKTRRARLQEFQQALLAMEAATKHGAKLIADALVASRSLSDLRARDERIPVLRDRAVAFAGVLNVPNIGDSEPLEEALDRFMNVLIQREKSLAKWQSVRREAQLGLRTRQSVADRCQQMDHEIRQRNAELERAKAAKERADARVQEARDLSRRARDARTNIVRRVFNESLNAVWQELFVRLAPDERFVPAFALPEGHGGPVEAILETHYRSGERGGKGGNPKAMLSAGNLNTAALTLFLALHLSVAPSLPWLVIDDPVQSMDEVHIAQFAALLRTLSKQHKRQIVIAVHERSLFEYLTLELSPAFAEDRLVTIDLGRAANGSSVVNYEPVIWKPDTAIAA